MRGRWASFGSDMFSVYVEIESALALIDERR